jgi:hypothetical protein
MLRRCLFYATLERARAGRWSPDRGLITNPHWARFSGPRPKHELALGAGLLTPPKCLTDRSPSFGVSLASTNTSETWVCDERGRPVGRARGRGRETRAQRDPRPARPAPSATRSPRDPFGDAYSPPRAIPWADLLAAPFTARSKVRNIKTGESGSYVP